MLSVPIPHPLTLSICTSHLKREGPYGSFLTPTSGLILSLLDTPSGRRLFVRSSSSNAHTSASTRAFLSLLTARRHGLAYGYRRRLRLVGVGFRASTVTGSDSSTATTLKLGYSHELVVNAGLKDQSVTEHQLRLPDTVSLQASRLDGRAKGTLLLLQGPTLAAVNQAAAKVRALRHPDPYKGKGIHYDREVLNLKKGKGDR
jgi:large subunit ribosomal protein L6